MAIEERTLISTGLAFFYFAKDQPGSMPCFLNAGAAAGAVRNFTSALRGVGLLGAGDNAAGEHGIALHRFGQRADVIDAAAGCGFAILDVPLDRAAWHGTSMS